MIETLNGAILPGEQAFYGSCACDGRRVSEVDLGVFSEVLAHYAHVFRVGLLVHLLRQSTV